MRIRTATTTDADIIQKVYLAAFDDEEKELVARLAVELLRETSTPEILHLIAEEGDRIVGHIAFSPVSSQSGGKEIGYILAPLAVTPEDQEKGIGSKLVREGLRILENRDIQIVFVYGDPNYYGKFGFLASPAEKFIPPYSLKYPSGWLAVALNNEGHNDTLKRIECVSALNKAELW
jgi:putative acetyltransferase